VRGALTQLIGERFTGRELSLSSDAEMPGAFFSRWALQAHLLEGTIGPRALAGWLGGQALDPTQIEALTDLHSSHHLGTNATRAWGFWSCYRATGDDDWRDAFTRHLSASIDLHDSWCHDRRAYGHWVPQFTLYAIHLATEDSADANGDALR